MTTENHPTITACKSNTENTQTRYFPTACVRWSWPGLMPQTSSRLELFSSAVTWKHLPSALWIEVSTRNLQSWHLSIFNESPEHRPSYYGWLGLCLGWHWEESMYLKDSSSCKVSSPYSCNRRGQEMSIMHDLNTLTVLRGPVSENNKKLAHRHWHFSGIIQENWHNDFSP